MRVTLEFAIVGGIARVGTAARTVDVGKPAGPIDGIVFMGTAESGDGDRIMPIVLRYPPTAARVLGHDRLCRDVEERVRAAWATWGR